MRRFLVALFAVLLFSSAANAASTNSNVTGTGNVFNPGRLCTPPTGGTTGQVLAKNSSANCDLLWQTATGGGTTIPGGAGIVAQTSTGNYANRTITGTANEITLTNGDGVSGNPTVSIPSAVTFTSKTITGGTYTSVVSTNLASLTGQYLSAGLNALRLTSTGNLILGDTAFDPTLSPQSIAIGKNALAATTTALGAVAIGHLALTANTSGVENTCVGWSCLTATTTGADNTAVGWSALTANTVGTRSTAMGSSALAAQTTGTGNTAIGYQACNNVTTGSGNTCLGAGSQALTATGNNDFVLGTSSQTVRAPGSMTAGSTSAATLLTANSSAISALSVFSSNSAGAGINIGGSASGVRTFQFYTSSASKFGVFDSTGNATPLAITGGSSGNGAQIAENANGVIGFSSNGQFADQGSVDTAISRLAAGSIAVGTGASGNTAGKITAAAFVSAGTTFTISGCSATVPVGGATAGHFTSGTTGTCTVTITMNGATGAAAPNGWICDGADRTTVPALFTGLFMQTGSSTTTATMAGTTVSGDDMQFKCVGY